jgi:hypothetical protein
VHARLRLNGTPISDRGAAFFAYASGAAGILSNLSLIGFYALQVGRPERGLSLGYANDLVGSLGTALMIPVAFALTNRLPQRRTVRVTQAVGLSAMAVLTIAGPLLVFGALTFEVSTPISLAAFSVFAVWLLLVNRWLRQSAALGPRVARLGEFFGAGPLAGGAIVGLGLLLPWTSWPQLVIFGVGGLLAVVAMLGIPIWFLLLGRHLAGAAQGALSQEPGARPRVAVARHAQAVAGDRPGVSAVEDDR